VRPLLEYVLSTEPIYEVVAVESLANALKLLEEQPFDLVVTDVNLPDGSGLRVADKGKEKGIGVLVVTAHGLTIRPGDLDPYDYLLEFLDAVRHRLPRGQSEVAHLKRRYDPNHR
jgi:CheY-like chemotaxis protein